MQFPEGRLIVLSKVPLPGQVKTRLVRPDDEDVTLDYRLRKTDTGWRIIDVYANGTISELALRRSEYSALLRREGFASLIEALDKKSGEFRAS